MRLIDADALKEKMQNSLSYNDYEWAMYADEFFDEMKNAPTIEAAYLCNREKCDRCNRDCDLTRDTNYAATTDKVIIIDGAAYTVKGKPAGQWIPVTERLPERKGSYLVTVVEHGNEQREVEEAGYINGKWYTDDGEVYSDWYKGSRIIAWMPLPEPYKEADR